MRLITVVLSALAAPWLLVCVGEFGGLRVNTTPSIPIGVYRVTTAPVRRGSYVMFCPPNTPTFVEARARGYLGYGQCEGGYVQLMKFVLAAPGDHVQLRADGVFVNGRKLAHSVRREFDERGRALPQPAITDCVLGTNEWLVMSATNDASFDSRYFGALVLKNPSHIVPWVVAEERP